MQCGFYHLLHGPLTNFLTQSITSLQTIHSLTCSIKYCRLICIIREYKCRDSKTGRPSLYGSLVALTVLVQVIDSVKTPKYGFCVPQGWNQFKGESFYWADSFPISDRFKTPKAFRSEVLKLRVWKQRRIKDVSVRCLLFSFTMYISRPMGRQVGTNTQLCLSIDCESIFPYLISEWN